MYRYEENQIIKKEVPGLATSPHRVTTWSHSDRSRFDRALTLWHNLSPSPYQSGVPTSAFDLEWDGFSKAYPIIAGALLPTLNAAGFSLTEAKIYKDAIDLGAVFYDRKALPLYPPEFMEACLHRLASGDFGKIGKILDRDLTEDEQFAPPLYSPAVQATAAIARGVGIVCGVYHVERGRYDTGPRVLSVGTIFEGGASRTLIFAPLGGNPERI